MMRARSILALILALLATGCTTSTGCDCIAPTAFVHGNVSGTLAPVGIEVRMAAGDCSSGAVPSASVTQGRSDARGDYEVLLYLNETGPTCLVVTALTLDLPVTSVTRRVPVTLEVFDAANPQRIRVDLALETTSGGGVALRQR